jgi:hypothetical protein
MVTRQRIDRLLSIQEIKANPRNARTHSKAQIRQIAESIKAFGFGAPVLVDETFTLICGYGRLKAAERLNIGRYRLSNSLDSPKLKGAPLLSPTIRAAIMPAGTARVWRSSCLTLPNC